MSIIIIIVTTIVIYIMLENNKIEMLFNDLRRVDTELERRMVPYISGKQSVDVFTVQEMREMIRNEFINKHLIDDFNLYKEDMHKLRLVIRRGLAVQNLDLVTTSGSLKLIEKSMKYSDIEFVKK